MTVAQQLNTIADILANRETVPMDFAQKSLALLDIAPKAALEMLVARKVKFLWLPAKRRLDAMK
jgi:hypothetical protein